MILQLIYIILAAICKAMTDTIAFHGGGIFHKNKFFDITTQGEFFPYSKYRIDGFHIFNSLMILFFILAVTGLNWKLAVAGIIYILIFNFFWNKIFN